MAVPTRCPLDVRDSNLLETERVVAHLYQILEKHGSLNIGRGLMKIAIALSKLDPHHGGAEAWTIGLADWLSKRGHIVHLFGTQPACNLPLPSSHIHVLQRAAKRQIADELAVFLQREDFDIVHDMGVGTSFNLFQSHFGSLLAMEQAKAFAYSFAHRFSRRLIQPFSVRRKMLFQLARDQFSAHDALFIAVSHKVADDLAALEKVPPEKISVVRNGVDVERFIPANRDEKFAAREKLAISESEFVVSTIAHNHVLKGVPHAVRFLSRQKRGTFHLIVAGGHRIRPKKLTIGNHRISYIGSIADPIQVYHATDAFLHLTYYDACSLCVLEAMACGLPVITTRHIMVLQKESYMTRMALLLTSRTRMINCNNA